MPLIIADLHSYTVHGARAVCGLRVFTRGTDAEPKLLVILSELPENTGMSVTNRVEHLIAELEPRLLKILPPGFQHPRHVTWIEHYFNHGQPDSYDLVELRRVTGAAPGSHHPTQGRACAPHWLRLTTASLEALISPKELRESADRLNLRRAN